jgi:hypothetical protein
VRTLRLAILLALAACGHREPQPIAVKDSPAPAVSDAAPIAVDSPAAMPDAAVAVDAAAIPADAAVTSPINVQNSYRIVKLEGAGPDTMIVVDGSERGSRRTESTLVSAGGSRPAVRSCVQPRLTHLKAAMSVDRARGYSASGSCLMSTWHDVTIACPGAASRST